MRLNFFLATSIIALASTPAAAQTADKDFTAVPGEPSGSATQGGLQEIIVTAQRRAESLQDAPVAVDVVTGNALLKANVTEAADLQQLVPSLIIEPTSTGNLVFIRGIGNFTLTNNADPATAFNYDEVYISRPNSSDVFFYDLERVEVLKGPQGTLYGRNATAGAINVIPAKPRIGEFSGYVSGSYGNYETHSLEAALNVPMGDSGALRVSGNLSKHDGYLQDGTSDEDKKSVRVQLLGEVTPDLTIRTSLDYSHQGGVGAGASISARRSFNPATQTFTTQSVPLAIDSGLFSPETQQFRQSLVYPQLGATAGLLDGRAFRDNHFYGAHANVEWRTSVGTLTVIPAWRTDELNFSNFPAFEVLQDIDVETMSLEARFATERLGIFDFTFGGLLYDETLDATLAASLEAAALFQEYTYKTKSQAAYLRATAHLTDRLRITGGVRYTHDKKSAVDNATSLIVACPRLANGIPCPNAPLLPFTETLAQQPNVPAQGGPPIPLGTTGAILIRLDPSLVDEINNGEITWRGAVEFDLSPSSLVYASVETGYRSGGFNPAGSLPYDPEYITAYTIGSKNQFWNNRIRLNVEAFLWKYNDQQLSFIGLTPSGTPANQTTNIGRLTAKGVEAELSALVTESILLSANVLYLDSSYDDFVYQTPTQAGVPNTGCNVSPNANPLLFDVNCTGRTAYNSPKWTFNLSAQQTIPVGEYNLVLLADTQFRDSRFVFINYTPDQFAPSYWASNAQISFGPQDGRWEVSAYVRNIENERQPVFSPQHPFLPITTTTYTAPRTYGARAFFRF